MTIQAPRAKDLGITSCLVCALVQRDPGDVDGARCPRCSTAIRTRKKNSLHRAWAFLLAALALYVPANILPVMQTTRLTEHRSDTILSGVAYLWEGDSKDLAIIVFTASIAVPCVKIIALASIAWSAKRGSPHHRRERAFIFHVTEYIGHWSMLDVFVVALLVSLVKFGKFADIEPLGGVVLFAGVVVMTMLASVSFDPRLIWDGPHE